MKRNSLGLWKLGTALTALVLVGVVSAAVQQTASEIYGTGDFDGDGLTDVVIVDKPTGKYRLGYQQPDGSYQWVDQRGSDLKGVTGLAIGHFLDPKKDSLVLISADINRANLIDVSQRGVPGTPEQVVLDVLGPNVGVAAAVEGPGHSDLDDLCLASIYNDPVMNHLTFLRNTQGKLSKVIADHEVQARMAQPDRVVLQTGGRSYTAALWAASKHESFRIDDLRSGKSQMVAEVDGLPQNSAYVLGHFRGAPLVDLVCYQPGGSNLVFAALAESGGKYSFGPTKHFSLSQPVRLLVAVPGGKGSRLLAVSSKGTSGEVYDFDGSTTPKPVLSLKPDSGDLFFGATTVGQTFIVFTAPDYSKFSMNATVYRIHENAYASSPPAKLGSMADNDDATVPSIWSRAVKTLKSEGIKSQADMRPYTNTIPGTHVTFAMVPIHGGEFLMGSPASEKGHKPDEGPQHKVKISPFWMGKYEVTWDQYELFMYPDDEKKLRTEYPTAAYINAVSDAVTRPSKPYMEMSFGMGKDGCPAISMTQHAASKFCQWLSAKTGQFYRLPTEAEWEYACRAGTTTAYFFGNDPSKLDQYAWDEDNSDYKYHRVGTKKPNPWGLYDIIGNVDEWCLDQYTPNYNSIKNVLVDPWNKATTLYPRVVRGGSFDDPPSALRSAARRGSDPSWKMRDPQLPKSIWWLTDAQFVGFRIVRPLKVPSAAKMQEYWNSGPDQE